MGSNDLEAGFAKLQGEDFEYYMQTYSITLGRNSKKSTVDVDLYALGGGMNISRLHARIFYQFERRRFALEVLGKNGCFVEGVLHLPGSPPVKLDSQDLLQIGDKEFYFLLPVRSISGRPVRPRHHANNYQPGSGIQYQNQQLQPHHPGLRPIPTDGGSGFGKKGKGRNEYYNAEGGGGAAAGEDGSSERRRMKRDAGADGYAIYGSRVKGGSSGHHVKKDDESSLADVEIDNKQLLQLEEKDVVSTVSSVLSDPCVPGERIPAEKLHTELVGQSSNKYMAPQWSKEIAELRGLLFYEKPWFGKCPLSTL